MKRTLSLFIMLGAAFGCKRSEPPLPPPAVQVQAAAPATKPEPRVTAAMPQGWKALENVEEPPDVVLLGAWEHPDFLSLIKVKLLDPGDRKAAEFAMEAATVCILQGYDVAKIDLFDKDGMLFVFDLKRDDGTVAAKSRMLFRPVGSKVLLVMGMWPAEADRIGSAAFDAALAGITIE